MGGCKVQPQDKRSKELTINEIALELGISKTTVSRAISGKGRVSAETRQRVMDFIHSSGYRPNGPASCLVKAKTGNLCLVLPSDPNIIDTPFFLGCIVGICDTAAFNEYNVIVVTETNNSENVLRDMIDNHKIDGVIFSRALIDESQLQYVRTKQMPFLVIGSSREQGVVQVDNDVFASCTELTKILIAANERVALLAGNQNHRVQKLRYEGFIQAHLDMDRKPDKTRVFLNTDNKAAIDKALSQLFEMGVDCIIANDDVICSRVLSWLNSHNYRIPHDVRVASFYSSTQLAENNPPITAINISPRDIGTKAAQLLLQMIDGQPVKQKNKINYEIMLRKSTM